MDVSVDHHVSVSDIDAPLVAALLLTLEEMVKGYQRLLAVLQREKELIIEGNVNDLRVYLIEKANLLEDLKRLEETRSRQVASISPSEQPLTLLEVMERVPPAYRGRFASSYERLRALSASVSDLNQINGLLSTRILQHVYSLLGLLTHLSGPSVYHPTGALHPEFQNGYYTARPVGLFYYQG